MYALRERKKHIEEWEFKSEKEFALVIKFIRANLQKQIMLAKKIISFLLFLTYKGVKYCFSFARILLFSSSPSSDFYSQSNEIRKSLNSHPSLWLK